MDDIINDEFLKDKTLVCASEELQKLATPEGCNFNIAPDCYVVGDEENMDEVEDDEGAGPSRISRRNRTEAEKMDLLKKEYFKLISDCDRDLQPNKQNIDSHIVIHKRFEKTEAPFESLLEDPAFCELPQSGGQVFKKLLQPGSGPPIGPDSVVIYNVAFWTEGRPEPYDSTWLRREPFLSDLKVDNLTPGFRHLLLNMRKSEWSEALIRAEASFGRLGVPPRIPENADIYCVVEIVNFIEKDRIAQLAINPRAAQEEDAIEFDEFFRVSDEARKRGNYYLGDKQYKLAMRRYKSGIRIMETITYKDEQEEARAKELLVKLFVNLARAANNDGQPRIALAMCKRASLLNELNPKIFYQRMLAWKIKGHTDLALGVARQAIQLFQADQNSLRYFRLQEEELKHLLRKETDERKKLERLMSKAIIS